MGIREPLARLDRAANVDAALNGGNSAFNRLQSLQGLFNPAFDAENYKGKDKPDYGKKEADHPDDNHQSAKYFHDPSCWLTNVYHN